jgi:hypothetical protein
MRLVLPLCALLIALAAPAAAQIPLELDESVEGTLSPDDPRDSRGRHYDAYRFEARAGQAYVIIVATDDYDARLQAGPAAGDDCSPCVTGDEGYEHDARVDVRAEESGTYVVRVTSERAGATGRYVVGVGEDPFADDGPAATDTTYTPTTDTATIQIDTDTVVPTMTVDTDTVALLPDEVEPEAGGINRIAQGQERAGTLDESDDEQANPDGYYSRAEVWFYEGRAGETITATVRSADFDAMVEVVLHDGYGTSTPLGTDDNGGGGTDARVRATLPDYGPVEVRVTAKERDRLGAYTLHLESDQPVEPENLDIPQDFLRPWEPTRGRLEAWSQMVDGRPAHDLEFRGRRGATVTLTVRSDDFDPTMVVSVGPTGRVLQATPASGGGREARLTLTLPYTTSYLVRVSPARAGQLGEYEVTLDVH